MARNKDLEDKAIQYIYEHFGNAPTLNMDKEMRRDFNKFAKEGYEATTPRLLVAEFQLWKILQNIDLTKCPNSLFKKEDLFTTDPDEPEYEEYRCPECGYDRNLEDDTFICQHCDLSESREHTKERLEREKAEKKEEE